MRCEPRRFRCDGGRRLSDREGEVVGVGGGFGDGIAVHRKLDDGTRGVVIVEDGVTIKPSAGVNDVIAVAVGGGPETAQLDDVPDPCFRVLGTHRVGDVVTEDDIQRKRHRAIGIEPVGPITGGEVLDGHGEPVAVGIDRADLRDVADIGVVVIEIAVVRDVTGGLVTSHLAVIRVAVAVTIDVNVPGGLGAVAVGGGVVFGFGGGVFGGVVVIVAIVARQVPVGTGGGLGGGANDTLFLRRSERVAAEGREKRNEKRFAHEITPDLC